MFHDVDAWVDPIEALYGEWPKEWQGHWIIELGRETSEENFLALMYPLWGDLDE